MAETSVLVSVFGFISYEGDISALQLDPDISPLQ
jgi:hypothetical protein